MVDRTRPRAGSGQPDRRPHRLHRRAGAADGDRPVDRDPLRPATTDRAVVGRRAGAGRPAAASSTIPPAVEPAWGRYVAGVVGRAAAADGHPRPRSPPTSRSAPACPAAPRSRWRSRWRSASTVTPVELAQLCRRAEHRASGVPSGIMDQLSIAAWRRRPCAADRLPRADGRPGARCRTTSRWSSSSSPTARWSAARTPIGSPSAPRPSARSARCARRRSTTSPASRDPVVRRARAARRQREPARARLRRRAARRRDLRDRRRADGRQPRQPARSVRAPRPRRWTQPSRAWRRRPACTARG